MPSKHHQNADEDIFGTEIARQLRVLLAELQTMLQVRAAALPSDPALAQHIEHLLAPVWRSLLEARNVFFHGAASGPTEETQGFAFYGLRGAPSAEQLAAIGELISPDVQPIVLSRNVTNSARDLLLFLVVSGRSIRQLLESEFGCDAETAAKAEDLVREFLRASKGIDLDATHSQSAHQKTPLPTAPPKYAYEPRQAGGIVAYLEDNWGDLIRSGDFTRPDLRRIDPPAAQALTNWLRKNELPPTLPLLGKSDVVDREAAQLGVDIEAARRVGHTLKQRRQRKPPPEPS